jgi:hypothetical protein
LASVAYTQDAVPGKLVRKDVFCDTPNAITQKLDGL